MSLSCTSESPKFLAVFCWFTIVSILQVLGVFSLLEGTVISLVIE